MSAIEGVVAYQRWSLRGGSTVVVVLTSACAAAQGQQRTLAEILCYRRISITDNTVP